MRRRKTLSAVVLPALVGSLSLSTIADVTAADPQPLVRVNRDVVTREDFELACLVRGIDQARRSEIQQQLLERLVDERLIAEFLNSRRIKASPQAIDAQVDLIRSLILRQNKALDEVLDQLGFDMKQLRETLSLPLAWNSWVNAVVTDERLRAEFEAHRRELDGTKLRARHIVLIVNSDADETAWIEAEQDLMAVRQKVASGQLGFVEAAKQFSQGPSADAGGDVGFFPFRGIMSAAFADAAYALEQGEVSQPVRTSVGVHLIEVIDEQPGQLSLEDVRSAVFERISRRMWAQQVAELRAGAKIVWSE